MNYESRVEPATRAAPASEISGGERYGYLPVGKSTALPKLCQEFADPFVAEILYGLLSSAGVSRNSNGSWQHSHGPGLCELM